MKKLNFINHAIDGKHKHSFKTVEECLSYYGNLGVSFGPKSKSTTRPFIYIVKSFFKINSKVRVAKFV